MNSKQGNPIYELRLSRGKLVGVGANQRRRPMCQKKFAKLIGVSQGTVSKLETEQTSLSVATLARVRDVAGIKWVGKMLDYYSVRVEEVK